MSDKYYAVCEKCLVIALTVREKCTDGSVIRYCRCPICGNGNTQLSNKDMGWTQQWIEDNYEFYLFTRGIDYASFSR